MLSKSEKSSALSDSEHVCWTVDQTGCMWTHTEPRLCYKVTHCSPVVLTFGAGFRFILISTCPKTAVSQAKQDDFISLRLCRDPVSGQWCMEAHDERPTMTNIHKDSDTYTHINLHLGLHRQAAPVVLFLHSLLNSETQDLRWRKMLNNGILKKMIIKKSIVNYINKWGDDISVYFRSYYTLYAVILIWETLKTFIASLLILSLYWIS